MFVHKYRLLIVIGILGMLSGCGASKEMQTYFDEVHEGVNEKNMEIEEATTEFIEFILSEEPEKVIDILEEKVIPLHESIIEMLDGADVTEEALTSYNDMSKQVIQLNLEKNEHIKDFFKEAIEKKEAGDEENLDIDANLEKLFDLNEKHIATAKDYKKETDKIAEESDYLELDEEAMVLDPEDLDAEELNADYEQLVMAFIESVGGFSSGSITEAADVDKEILEDQGNPEVVFDGEVTLDGKFELQGKSNLPEGSVLQMKTYEYGTENPSFKGDIPVENDGSFFAKADLEDDVFEGDSLVVRLAYIPDSKENEANAGIYGEEGEKLEGDFIHPYTDIKRTRHGAFAYAYLELNEGAEAPIEADAWGDAPDDYGDLDIWMEEANIETHDKYYDITMNSNLQELTYIKASIEIPGYEVGGYRSNSKVLPDGSFRFQLPRPDVDSDEVTVVIHTKSDMAIDTEELYGENGENFEGDLVEKTKKGQQIEYKMPLGDDS